MPVSIRLICSIFIRVSTCNWANAYVFGYTFSGYLVISSQWKRGSHVVATSLRTNVVFYANKYSEDGTKKTM